MTIAFVSARSDMPKYPCDRSFKTGHALHFLVEFVFGWSGHVTGLTIEGDVATLSVRTSIFDYYDCNTFTGTLAEMRPLLQAARFHILLMKKYGRAVYEQAVELVTEFTTNPLLVTSLMPIVAGYTVAHDIYLSLLAEHDAALPAQLSRLSTEELGAAMAFLYEGSPLEDVLACI
jgi:hypothetical protein